jgi:pimeloyl-ACP methyl ester carboxylesterase
LVRCLRLARTGTALGQSNWSERLAESGVLLTSTVPHWTLLGFDTLQFADEFRTRGPGQNARRVGLGVPLIAYRRLAGTGEADWKPYGPHDSVFAATAVIQPRGSPASWRNQPVELVLHDPLHEDTVTIAGSSLPLAASLTPPLIVRLTQRPIRNYKYQGVLDPECYSAHAGVYAIDPYQPGKMPVVLVHGLWSSPAAWIPMLETLRGDPALRAQYQFWVVLYPAGYPLPVAALSLRRSLREIRQRFDPRGMDPALDNMVILGKSTGGQAVRMLVERSGDSLWNAIFTRPLSQVSATPELRSELSEMFFLQPEPYIRRVIFLTTSHRGSERARQLRLRLGIELIQRSNPLIPAWAELEAANGRALFQPFFRDRAPTSADGIEADNPLLLALHSAPIAPGLVHHSIIANIRRKTTPEVISDGFVDYWSAHLDSAASEHIVAATHACEANPDVIAEVRRILTIHLIELNRSIDAANRQVASGKVPALD